ncbi:glycoside hydrolase family 13 protein [Streptomyces sp. NPDC102381]|uniref:glycoside hydrolase family 13 protein n=1 Tax=Streptomyces sp. NPDC102381 TaxID=3366164 RepID=UPI0037FE214F
MTEHTTDRTPDTVDNSPQNADWWRQAVVYQIYPRSFADANGDGIGDLVGITRRLDHLADLGVDAIWLSPFYPSELKDGGYDVADYRDVDPRLGTLDDFDAMVAEAHRLGLKLFVDIVPNHTSDQHIWFQEALASPPGSPARERYVFRDGTGPDGSLPPTDWEASFSGNAWKQVPDGQWYLHLFAPEQPDLNWEHDDVRADFQETLRFWSDRGVDGFRIDVAHGCAKKLTGPLADIGRPQYKGIHDDMPPGTHPYWDRDEVHEIYRDWRAVLDSYTPPRVAVAEAWVTNSRRVLYTRPDELHQAFNFEFLSAPWRTPDLAKVISESLHAADSVGATATWVLSNHDVVRHASRLGLPPGTDLEAWLRSDGHSPEPDRELGLRRARAATLLMLALPGSAYIYQGEELGLPEVADLRVEDLQDPVYGQSGGRRKGRDGCRVPLPWDTDGPSYGFGDAPAWLPQPEGFGALSVAAQDRDPDSHLAFYRTALRLRRELLRPGSPGSEVLGEPQMGEAEQLLHFTRPDGWECVVNVDGPPAHLPPGEVLLASGPLTEDGLLPADTAVWLRTGGSDSAAGVEG